MPCDSVDFEGVPHGGGLPVVAPADRRLADLLHHAGDLVEADAPARKASTAISLAALSTVGRLPPAFMQSMATRRAGKRTKSGRSKDRDPMAARSSLRTFVSTRSG